MLEAHPRRAASAVNSPREAQTSLGIFQKVTPMATYSIKGNRTAADVVNENDEIIETGYDLESARVAAVEYQRTGEFVAAWVEEEHDEHI